MPSIRESVENCVSKLLIRLSQRLYNNYYSTKPTSYEDLERIAKSLILHVPDQRKDQSELVLDWVHQDKTWGYYFADTIERTVLWVHTISLSDVIQPNPRTVVSDSHLGLFIYHILT